MKILKCLLVFFSILCSILLCGCFDDKEINETAYIIALGIDKADDLNYTYTFQFSAPLGANSPESDQDNSDNSETSSDDTVNNVIITAPDFYVAKNMTNNFLSKNVDMSHLKLIVFSADLDPNGLSAHSQFLLREREIRPHTAVAVANDSAKDYLLSVNPELEANTAKYYELMALRSNNVYSPTKKLSDFIDESSTDGSASALPIAAAANSQSIPGPKTKHNKLWVGSKNTTLASSRSDFRGMAIFKKGILCGTMDGDSAMIYNILNRDIRSCVITLQSPYEKSEHFSFRLSVEKAAAYKVNFKATPPIITVTQPLGIEFLGNRVPDGFNSIDELYEFADSVLEAELANFFFDISRIKKADIMKIGDSQKKYFLTNDDWEKMNWDKLYQTADFDINIYFV